MADIGRREKDLDLVEEFETVRAVTSDGRSVQVPKTMFGGNLEVATEDVLGGIKASAKTDEETVEVKIDSNTGKLYVPKGEGNPPDEEDITLTEIDGTKKLQFNDKKYNASSFSGLGRVYLRKNMVDGVNMLIQSMFTNDDGSEGTNTRYIIQYDYDLNGATISLPEYCVLDFQGGSFSNGNIKISNSLIYAGLVYIFKENLTIEGSVVNDYIYPEWFGDYGLERAVDFYLSGTGQFIPTNKVIKLSGKTYNISKSITVSKPIHIEGTGWSTIVSYKGADNIRSVFNFTYDSASQISAPYSTIRKMIISGNKKSDSAIYGSCVSSCTMEWLRLEGYKYAIDIGFGFNNKILYCTLNSNDVAINTHSDSNNILIIDGCSINSNKLGAYITAGKSINITNTAFEANGAAIYINYLANTVNIDRCYFERNGIIDFTCVDKIFKSDIIINGSSNKNEFGHSHICRNINVQNCSIQNMYNQAFLTTNAVEGLSVANNSVTKLNNNSYKIVQLYAINYAKSTQVSANKNDGFDESFDVFGNIDTEYNQLFYRWKSDKESTRNYAVEDVRDWIVESNAGGIWARPQSELIEGNWLVSSLFFPKNNMTDFVYFELDIDLNPELSGKLLNFGFYQKGTNTAPTITIKAITTELEYGRTYNLSQNYTRRELYFRAPLSGKIKLGFKSSYSANVDFSVYIGKVFLCVVGANMNIIEYEYTQDKKYRLNKRGQRDEYLTNQRYKSTELPTLTAYDVGVSAFASDLKKPIWWNGSAWVDATGTEV